MPRTVPSEKTGHEGEWWRDDDADHPGDSSVNPAESAHANRDAGKNKFDEEQEPVKHPV